VFSSNNNVRNFKSTFAMNCSQFETKIPLPVPAGWREGEAIGGRSQHMGAAMKVERKIYPALGEPVGPYVHATKCNGMLFLSGLTAFGSRAQGRGVAEQAEVIFEQIKNVAAEEGSSLADLAKVTIFVTSFDEVGSLRDALFKIYGEFLPASSLVQVAGLFSSQVNIEVEAVLCVA
jgi:2-iminobutanoate/2-iminopropanoate deaminase